MTVLLICRTRGGLSATLDNQWRRLVQVTGTDAAGNRLRRCSRTSLRPGSVAVEYLVLYRSDTFSRIRD
eukprot:756290-Hanusia_phi.AAC.1